MKIENGTGCRLYTFNEYELKQHDTEVRNQVLDALLEWADSKITDWINSPKYREPNFRGTRIIHYYDLQQKLTELKGAKDE